MKKNIISAAVACLFFAACNSNSSTMAKGSDSNSATLTKNKQTALNNIHAYVKKDLDGAFKDYTTDFVDYGNGEMRPMKNQDSMKMDLKNFFVAFPDYKAENLKAVAEGNTVIVTADWSGTFKNEYNKVKPTGKSFKAKDADIFTFNDAGKITSHKTIQSITAIFYQLGIPMSVLK
jgi:predicted ester cyclase